jgi:hypothetical protein
MTKPAPAVILCLRIAFFTILPSLALQNTLYFVKKSFGDVIAGYEFSDYGNEHAGKSKQAVVTSSAHAA